MIQINICFCIWLKNKPLPQRILAESTTRHNMHKKLFLLQLKVKNGVHVLQYKKERRIEPEIKDIQHL